MADSLHRRDFAKVTSLLGASVVLDSRAAAQDSSGDYVVEGPYLTLSFNPAKGTFSARRPNGRAVLSGGTTCAHTSTGRHSISFERHRFTVRKSAFEDQLGSGNRMVVFAAHQGGHLNFEIRVSLYENFDALTIEAIVKNVSGKDLAINSVEPIRAVAAEGSSLSVPGVAKCLTNGSMYYDTGNLYEFGKPYEIRLDSGIKGLSPANASLSAHHDTVRSWWNAGLFSGYDQEGIAIGYLENSLGIGQLYFSRSADKTLSLAAESLYSPGVTLKPGQSISSNPLMLVTDQNPYAALEAYAEAVGKFQNARTSSIVNGWCSWFYTLAQVTEDEVLRNAEFAAKHLKPYGLEYIQIDEGYQRWHGDWEGNERFPHGMKWLADRIREYGLRPGLWIAPYVIAEPTDVFQKHSEWLVKNPDGTPQQVGNWPEGSDAAGTENPKRYCLDITHPEAARWLQKLTDTIVHQWGYEMIKVDFVAWSILSAKCYTDASATAAHVYRLGFEIMRAAAGDKCHLLDCGPGATTVGLTDSMRIELDSGYGYENDVWKTYFTDPDCSASAAARRYYFHKRTWVNDVDHVCMDLLTEEQSQAAATLIAMSGGNMISGDRLTDLPAEKLEILKRITPSFGDAAVPVDLFDTDEPSVFALKVKRPFGEWTVAGFFNRSLTESVKYRFPLDRLWLDIKKKYLGFDFWKQQFVGEIAGEIAVDVPPGSVTLLSLHESQGRPQWLSTDRHIVQGAVELETLDWNAETQTLSGVSLGPIGTTHNVFVYVPGKHPWQWGGYVLIKDYDSYSLRLVAENIIRVHTRFDRRDTVPWRIDCEEFFKS